MKADISFAYITSNFHRIARLFAETNVAPIRGDPTSDFFGYYGFGSGIANAHGSSSPVPEWLHDYTLFEFPELNPVDGNADKAKMFFTGHSYLSKVLNLYYSLGKVIDIHDVFKYLNYLCAVVGVPADSPIVLKVKKSFEKAYANSNTTHSTSLKVVSGIVMVRTNRYGQTRLSFGGPTVDADPLSVFLKTEFSFLQVPDVINPATLGWKYSSQVGAPNHAKALMHSLSRYKLIGLDGTELDVAELSDNIQSYYKTSAYY
jgi:hypothetical protein